VLWLEISEHMVNWCETRLNMQGDRLVLVAIRLNSNGDPTRVDEASTGLVIFV
jgi:hypothetical protein